VTSRALRLVARSTPSLGLDESHGVPVPVAADIRETRPTFRGRGPERLRLPSRAMPGSQARMVRTLRRCWVDEAGWSRHQVAFTGHWRQGVALRS